MKNKPSPKGWYDRGHLPHFDDGLKSQFITIRLFDSLPQKILENWKKELEDLVEGEMILRERIEKYLDLGYGSCLLKDPHVAQMVQDSLLFFDADRYELEAWVIMPNHVHFLLTPYENFRLEDITHSIKSYTAHQANKILGRSGEFWQKESYDRFIRNQKHFENVVRYIEMNPVKAGLCKKPEDWVWSSAY